MVLVDEVLQMVLRVPKVQLKLEPVPVQKCVQDSMDY
jgi:hypothetical protein